MTEQQEQTAGGGSPEERERFEELADGVFVWWGDLGVHSRQTSGSS